MRSAILFVFVSSVAVFATLEFVPRGDRLSDPEVPAAESAMSKTGNEFKSERTDTLVHIARLDKELEHLKKQVDRLAQALPVAHPSGQLHHAQNTDSRSITTDEFDVEEDFNADQDEIRNYQVELEQRFDAETTDIEWVSRIEAEFESALNRLSDFGLKATTMVYHECRATLCNAEFMHGKDEDTSLFLMAFAMPGIEEMSVVTKESEDGGELVSQVYFFREGFAASADAAE